MRFAQRFAAELHDDQPLYGIQSRGLDGCEEPLTTIPEMASHYIKAIKTVQRHGPYRVGGFSMGALLALEMACQLQDASEGVSHLTIFSTGASGMNISTIPHQIDFHRRQMGAGSFWNACRYVLSRVGFRLYRFYLTAVHLACSPKSDPVL